MCAVGDLICISVAVVCLVLSKAKLTHATRCKDEGALEHAYIRTVSPGKIYFLCKEGYVLEGSPKQECNSNGQWEPPQRPACVARTCLNPPHVINAFITGSDHAYNSDGTHAQNTMYSVHCLEGYHVDKFPDVTQYVIMCSITGKWVQENTGKSSLPNCVRKASGNSKPCSNFPFMAHTDSPKQFTYNGAVRSLEYHCKVGYSTVSGPRTVVLRCVDGQWKGEHLHCILNTLSSNIRGIASHCSSPPTVPHAESKVFETYASAQVHYYCHNGYKIPNGLSSNAILKCVDGNWRGTIPTCIPIITCPAPQSVFGGFYKNLVGGHENKFVVGDTIKYDCYPNFKIVGLSVLECQGNGHWSPIAPSCVEYSEVVVYCQNPGELYNGQCLCAGQYDLSYCEPFSAGRWLACSCNSGYVLEGEATITCTQTGVWTKLLPSCRKVPTSYDSNNIVDNTVSEKESHMSTLAILIATACSVLGVLLLIMIIVIFRRRKTRPRLYHHLPAPPPYSRGSGTYGENDRLAFMAYIESLRNPLPSYEEATRQESGGRRPPNVPPDQQSPDYRPLPNLPSGGMQLNSHAQSQVAVDSVSAGNRNSTITMSTINRDGMSEVFGSLDTVNVSVSDASTAVTVDTYDSGTSNRSICSQRATAGSIGSSNGSLANEDAPLLVRNNSPNNEMENDTNEADEQVKDD